MWYAMSNLQQSHDLSERLIRAISDWRTLTGFDDEVEQLLEDGADINRLHGTLLPLHCACMVADSYCLQLLLRKGAEVNVLWHLLKYIYTLLRGKTYRKVTVLQCSSVITVLMKNNYMIKKNKKILIFFYTTTQ